MTRIDKIYEDVSDLGDEDGDSSHCKEKTVVLIRDVVDVDDDDETPVVISENWR